jgi:hypothetical protein
VAIPSAGGALTNDARQGNEWTTYGAFGSVGGLFSIPIVALQVSGFRLGFPVSTISSHVAVGGPVALAGFVIAFGGGVLQSRQSPRLPVAPARSPTGITR